MAQRMAGAERQQQILEAAVRIFAERGFAACRVADIADEAGVAYGLVYHYFKSKEVILDTVFADRWRVMREAIAEIDRRDAPAQAKLEAVAGFIIDSYRHEPDLMKVIIVEVTRASSSHGKKHLDEIALAYDGIAKIVAGGQATGEFNDSVAPRLAAVAFYGAIEQILTGRIFSLLDVAEADFDGATARIVATVCGGLVVARTRDVDPVDATNEASAGAVCLDGDAMKQNDLVQRLVWAGLLAGIGALSTMVTARVATVAFRQIFAGQDPPE